VASKTSRDLVISHLCGSRNCVTQDHLILEPKSVNDERVHCHFCMERVFSSGGWERLMAFKQFPFCPHQPHCGSTDMSSSSSSTTASSSVPIPASPRQREEISIDDDDVQSVNKKPKIECLGVASLHRERFNADARNSMLANRQRHLIPGACSVRSIKLRESSEVA